MTVEDKCSSGRRRKSHFTLMPLGTTLTVPQVSGLAFSSRGAPIFSLREWLIFTRRSNQSGRLREVPLCHWRLLSRNIFRRLEEVIVVGGNGAELGWRPAVAIAVDKPFGEGRGATQPLQGGIIASGLLGTVYISLTFGLSFTKNSHLPHFRKIAQPRLGTNDIRKIVVTNFAAGGGTAFIDG